MIKIANSEKSFKLTTNTQQDMDVFRELGNLFLENLVTYQLIKSGIIVLKKI